MHADVYGNITFGVCTQNTKKGCCHIYGFALSAARFRIFRYLEDIPSTVVEVRDSFFSHTASVYSDSI